MAALKSSPNALVAQELSRLIDSEALRRAPSHTRLLRYLVERRMAGDATAFRETSIALEVFRRDPATYDPQSDPIVRVTMRRLRERLEAHYAHYDQLPKLRIVLPKGRYEPEFVGSVDTGGARLGVAVARTRNATGEPGYDILCAGFADRLADGLARIGVPRIIARDSVDQAERDCATQVGIGDALGVEWLVESSVGAEPDGQLRVTARLLDAADASVQWVETQTRDAAQRFATLDAIADRVFARFAARLSGHEVAPEAGGLAGLSADERQALDVVVMRVLERNHADIERELGAVAAVAAAHPGCAAAWAAIASARFTQAGLMDRDFAAAYAAARAAAERALALGPDRPDATITLAAIAGARDLDWKPAIARLRAVLRHYPHVTAARTTLASLLHYVGEFDEALHELAIGRAHDPLSVLLRMSSANILSYARRHDESRRQWSGLLASGVATFPLHALMGNNELWAGDVDAAERLYAEARTRLPGNPTPWMCLAIAYARRGDVDRAREQEAACLARFPGTSSYHRAMLASTLRDKPAALAWLVDARERHDALVMSACVDPSFDWLANDAGFNRQLQDWGLPGWRGGVLPA